MTRRFDDEHATEEEMGRAPYPGLTLGRDEPTPPAEPPNRPVRPPND